MSEVGGVRSEDWDVKLSKSEVVHAPCRRYDVGRSCLACLRFRSTQRLRYLLTAYGKEQCAQLSTGTDCKDKIIIVDGRVSGEDLFSVVCC